MEQIAKAIPNAGPLCLVDEYDLNQIVSLLQAGAAGILTRNATLPDLTRALIAASRGEIVLPPELAAQALAALARGGLRAQPNIETLTERERDVLALLAKGTDQQRHRPIPVPQRAHRGGALTQYLRQARYCYPHRGCLVGSTSRV